MSITTVPDRHRDLLLIQEPDPSALNGSGPVVSDNIRQLVVAARSRGLPTYFVQPSGNHDIDPAQPVVIAMIGGRVRVTQLERLDQHDFKELDDGQVPPWWLPADREHVLVTGADADQRLEVAGGLNGSSNATVWTDTWSRETESRLSVSITRLIDGRHPLGKRNGSQGSRNGTQPATTTPALRRLPTAPSIAPDELSFIETAVVEGLTERYELSDQLIEIHRDRVAMSDDGTVTIPLTIADAHVALKVRRQHDGRWAILDSESDADNRDLLKARVNAWYTAIERAELRLGHKFDSSRLVSIKPLAQAGVVLGTLGGLRTLDILLWHSWSGMPHMGATNQVAAELAGAIVLSGWFAKACHRFDEKHLQKVEPAIYWLYDHWNRPGFEHVRAWTRMNIGTPFRNMAAMGKFAVNNMPGRLLTGGTGTTALFLLGNVLPVLPNSSLGLALRAGLFAGTVRAFYPPLDERLLITDRFIRPGAEFVWNHGVKPVWKSSVAAVRATARGLQHIDRAVEQGAKKLHRTLDDKFTPYRWVNQRVFARAARAYRMLDELGTDVDRRSRETRRQAFRTIKQQLGMSSHPRPRPTIVVAPPERRTNEPPLVEAVDVEDEPRFALGKTLFRRPQYKQLLPHRALAFTERVTKTRRPSIHDPLAKHWWKVAWLLKSATRGGTKTPWITGDEGAPPALAAAIRNWTLDAERLGRTPPRFDLGMMSDTVLRHVAADINRSSRPQPLEHLDVPPANHRSLLSTSPTTDQLVEVILGPRTTLDQATPEHEDFRSRSELWRLLVRRQSHRSGEHIVLPKDALDRFAACLSGVAERRGVETLDVSILRPDQERHVRKQMMEAALSRHEAQRSTSATPSRTATGTATESGTRVRPSSRNVSTDAMLSFTEDRLNGLRHDAADLMRDIDQVLEPRPLGLPRPRQPDEHSARRGISLA